MSETSSDKPYTVEVKPSCLKNIRKSGKKNKKVQQAIENKITDILENPTHYKPLQYDRAGERRVHILKSFVLVVAVDEEKKVVTLQAFEHHDRAYKR